MFFIIFVPALSSVSPERCCVVSDILRIKILNQIWPLSKTKLKATRTHTHSQMNYVQFMLEDVNCDAWKYS